MSRHTFLTLGAAALIFAAGMVQTADGQNRGALAQAQRNVSLGTVFLKDYTLVASRIMLINRKAAHPNAARLWVDYILSKRGQTVIANNARLYAVRGDVEGETTASNLAKRLEASIRPIALGPGLIGYMNNQNYVDFIQQWRGAATP